MNVKGDRPKSGFHVRFLAAILLSAFAVAGCVCPACLLDHFVTVITPVEMTDSAITETFVRIDLYAKEHGTTPPSLDVLPERKGYMNRITDGWGRPLLYEVSDDGRLTLTSYGKDGKPGGSGEDADISRSYYSRRPDGSLWVGSDLWIVEAEVGEPTAGRSKLLVAQPNVQ
jgi:hypothetical protein